MSRMSDMCHEQTWPWMFRPPGIGVRRTVVTGRQATTILGKVSAGAGISHSGSRLSVLRSTSIISAADPEDTESSVRYLG
jgi:hypothetical protein